MGISTGAVHKITIKHYSAALSSDMSAWRRRRRGNTHTLEVAHPTIMTVIYRMRKVTLNKGLDTAGIIITSTISRYRTGYLRTIQVVYCGKRHRPHGTQTYSATLAGGRFFTHCI